MSILRGQIYNDACLQLIKEICDSEGHKFLGPFTGLTSNTKLQLVCKNGHDWNTSRMDNFKRGRRCPDCFKEKLADSMETAISKILSSGDYGDRYILCKEQKYDWKIKCKVCEVDEYSKAGIGVCVFNTNYNTLMNGGFSCRCSGGYGLTEEQQIFKANQHVRDKKWTCIGICESDKSRFKMNCVDHGDWFPNKTNFLKLSIGCPGCAESGFDRSKPAVFYVLICESKEATFVGFGITKDFDTRVKRHRCQLLKHGYHIVETKLFKMSGDSAYLLEKQILNELPKFKTEIEGFKREATYTDQLPILLDIVEKFTS